MNKLIEIIKSNKKKCLIILIIIILIFILLIYNLINNVKNNNRSIPNKEYVFTEIENSNIQRLPYINIKSQKVDTINDELSDEYFEIISDERNKFDYNYYVEDDILYLFVNIEKYNNDGIILPKYIAYYINTQNGKLYSIEEILDNHNLNFDEIKSKITQKIKETYNKETELGYVEKGFCDFECYLDMRDVNPLNKRLVLSYDGKNFIAYLNYEVETTYYVKENPIKFPSMYEL